MLSESIPIITLYIGCKTTVTTTSMYIYRYYLSATSYYLGPFNQIPDFHHSNVHSSIHDQSTYLSTSRCIQQLCLFLAESVIITSAFLPHESPTKTPSQKPIMHISCTEIVPMPSFNANHFLLNAIPILYVPFKKYHFQYVQEAYEEEY